MRPGDLHKGLNQGGVFRPQLTSLVDIMVILLFFLIQSFSVEGNLVTPSDDLQLPVSSANKMPQPFCGVHITKNNVLVEDLIVTTTEMILKSEDLLLRDLLKVMIAEKAKSKDPATANKLLIQADKDIPFAIIKKVMYTCSKAGFEDFKVLVIQEE
jgi:biopolymer transport protein ExbD